ncbi:5-formyltetrahydrofolate cyclo-ligase [Bosea beijingensis]|uniref:5-formyltetrahydrofolate cyclo-ligase n=1 Tax=Bosea beijingensis TaxID=3068632 RepID=UPI002741D5D3|nr:5-formyltetrahydrofolate cyclo-ligase [Bosea sp. REN20]
MTTTSDTLVTPSPRKAILRAEALARRDALDLDNRLEWDAGIAAHALSLPVWKGSSGPVSAYWPMRSEADPRPILEALRERGLPLCLPAIVEKRMVFRRWAPYEPIVPGGFGTLVPTPDQSELNPAILLVPLAAFDRRGYRIGYGKGYYDRALTELGPTVSIGIGYAAQEVDAVPDEPHDRRLDWIVTEREAIRCG